MANDVTTYILAEGPGKITVQVVIQGDGSGDLSNFNILDPVTDFTPTMPLGTKLSIMQIWASTAWFDVLIAFNGVVPTPCWIHSRDASSYYDFRYVGGLKDMSSEDPDGKVLLSTSDLTAGSVGTLIIEFKKH